VGFVSHNGRVLFRYSLTAQNIHTKLLICERPCTAFEILLDSRLKGLRQFNNELQTANCLFANLSIYSLFIPSSTRVASSFSTFAFSICFLTCSSVLEGADGLLEWELTKLGLFF